MYHGQKIHTGGLQTGWRPHYLVTLEASLPSTLRSLRTPRTAGNGGDILGKITNLRPKYAGEKRRRRYMRAKLRLGTAAFTVARKIDAPRKKPLTTIQRLKSTQPVILKGVIYE